jgi:methylglutaconyl-CoA hydratase
MNYQAIQIEQDARGVLTLTLNQPEKRNALSSQMIAELTEFAQTVEQHKARAVVLRGAGEVFCAGGDLAWMQQQMAADRATRMAEARKLARMLQALNTLPLPLIALVQGGAFGGGVGMASVCDYVIAETSARFGLTETRLGLIPATISPYVLARMGEGRARRVFMSARLFDAAEAERLGLVAEVVPDAAAGEVALERQLKPYFKAAPGAVAAAKALARSLGPRIDEAVIDRTIEALADTWEQQEAHDGIAAFFAKASPPWAV